MSWCAWSIKVSQQDSPRCLQSCMSVTFKFEPWDLASCCSFGLKLCHSYVQASLLLWWHFKWEQHTYSDRSLLSGNDEAATGKLTYKRTLTCTVLCMYLHIHLHAACMKNNWNSIFSRWLQVFSLVQNPSNECFKQTLKELAAAQDCTDNCSTRISHACVSSTCLVPVEAFHRVGWNGSRI